MLDYRLMITAIYSASMSSMVYPVCSQISLPFSDNKVAGMAFDGQPLDLYLDSGQSGTYVIYKEFYEKTYGRCPPKTCYTCIKKCHPYSHKLEMEFGVIIGWSPSPKFPTERPLNYLGLEYHRVASGENIMIQLFLKKIISEKRVSICVSSDAKTFTGEVILGAFKEKQCPTTSPKIVLPVKSSGYFDTALLSLGLVSPKGKSSIKHLPDGIAVYDTGTYCIVLPEPYFEFVLNTITQIVKQASGLDVRVEIKDGLWYIEQRGYDYLPRLAFVVGDPENHRTIYIPPRHYTKDCDGTWCILLLLQHNFAEILLGRPVFTTYFSSFVENKEGQRTATLATYNRGE
ncbi:hypothetical protein FOL47_000762 [Perkinsus chesapeaki]|uniref:Peptidase A1 domain-containing protein n=1 Tax=Perkinsus chesapeaki TaxID=330153 RepID=A0A7J6ML64_PERCH|nr:hypothetical protein FOL47_000762 [Perkinsus chesapeaki]